MSMHLGQGLWGGGTFWPGLTHLGLTVSLILFIQGSIETKGFPSWKIYHPGDLLKGRIEIPEPNNEATQL